MPDRRYSRTPDTVATLGACAVSGLTLALTSTVPTSVEGIVPWWMGLTWAVLFTASAMVSLIGLLHPDQIAAWFLEFTGRTILSACAAVYALALVAGAPSLGSAVIIALAVAVAVGSGGRAWQVLKRLDQLRADLREGHKR